jgi:DNA-binding LacI/PurR family transcriptional regulator/anti-anti-sigma regulatory factor
MTRPRTIGIVARYPYGFFFNTVLLGAQAAARRHGADLLVVQGSPASVAAAQLARNQVDAWIALTHMEGLEQLLAQGKPAVAIGAVPPHQICTAVVPDNRGGIEAAMEHLYGHGHERIAFVGWTAIGDINERYLGYQSALARRGLPHDLGRVVITNGPLIDEGQRAARQLIAAGMPCTAIVVGTDLNAIGVIQELRESGYRIPEDIAVVGFDDIPQAQSLTPPLSTVRQSFDALGAQAVETLLAALDGQPSPTSVIHTPVQFVQRQSCGCGGALDTAALADPERYRGPDWRARLERALVEVLVHPLAVGPAQEPAQLWPQVGGLVDTLAAAFDGAAELDGGVLRAAWGSDLALRANVETLYAALGVIEQAAAARSGGGERLRGLLDQLRLEMMRSYRIYQEARVGYLEQVVANTHRINLLLLDEANPQAQQLGWLSATQIDWGCLGLWRGPARGAHGELAIDQAYSRAADGAAPVGARYKVADFPPLELLPPQARAGGGATSLVLPLQTASREWGFLALAGTIVPSEAQFAEGATDNLVMWATQLAAMLERRELGTSLRQSYENERALASTVRELGAPTIPLLSGVLLIPLVGAIDSDRAQQVIVAVLSGVTEHHASVVLLDLTAVPIVDTQVANTLIQAAQAAILLGAQVTLVGIRPEIAQSIVSLGIDLRQIVSQPTLEVALQRLIARRGD